ncbi:MAG: DUF2569 domain-containing protein [Nitrospirae bacterium]|nr:DUF2569 domain-containing protein [Nitrospirota bacterium]
MRLLEKLFSKSRDKDKEANYSGIEGWLFLPAVSMVATPVLLASLILMNIKLMNNQLLKETFTQFPGLRAALISQTLIVAMHLVLVVYVSFLFFRKKQALPKMIIACLTVHMLIIVANVSWISLFFKELSMPENIGVISTIFITAVGIPYFVKSKRVKATFVNP